MIKAVLLDLDDTLLLNSDTAFIQAYLHAAEQFFTSTYNRPNMSQDLLQTLAAMQAPRDYQYTNTDIALQSMAAGDYSLEDLSDAFGRFYAEAYPALKTHTHHTDTALRLYQHLNQCGYAVVIATNPVYPATAIEQRLMWAGLPPEPENYAFVTTGDNMHTIKPNPAYYAEVLARVSVEPDEALMVGNSTENDMQPAAQLGLATYHVTTSEAPADIAHRAGTLENLLTMIQQHNGLPHFTPRPLAPAAILPQLRGNLAALFGLLATVQPHQWRQHPIPSEWSILEVMHHLVESETTIQRPRLERILNEDNPFLSPPAAPQPRPPADADGIALARQFVAEREKTIDDLTDLSTDDWQRPARHSTFGNTTLLEMAHFTAQHDRMHITQICQTLGRCD